MHNRTAMVAVFAVLLLVGGFITSLWAQSRTAKQPEKSKQPRDAVAEAQKPTAVPIERPEQKKSKHDNSDSFNRGKAPPITKDLADQQDEGEMRGFDFYRDPLGAMKPGMTFEDVCKAGVEAKPKVVATQRKLLEARYDSKPKLDPEAKMSRGKPIPVGPTAKLPKGVDWDALAEMTAEEISQKDIFPYKALPHPAQGGGLGGMVFPRMQIK
ncbi:MAG: hypothetical protein ACREHD_34220, partial [Pirellulales bacterium]